MSRLEKTAESSLSEGFAKLGVMSRLEKTAESSLSEGFAKLVISAAIGQYHLR